jgi:hypothetical protein
MSHNSNAIVWMTIVFPSTQAQNWHSTTFSTTLEQARSGAHRRRVHHGGARRRRGGGLAGRGRSRMARRWRGTSSTRMGSTVEGREEGPCGSTMEGQDSPCRDEGKGQHNSPFAPATFFSSSRSGVSTKRVAVEPCSVTSSLPCTAS